MTWNEFIHGLFYNRLCYKLIPYQFPRVDYSSNLFYQCFNKISGYCEVYIIKKLNQYQTDKIVGIIDKLNQGDYVERIYVDFEDVPDNIGFCIYLDRIWNSHDLDYLEGMLNRIGKIIEG